MIKVEVVYALPDEQKIIAVKLDEACSVYDAAVRSRIVEQFPEIDLASCKLGIFGRVIPKPKDELVRDGQRIEIYRPLTIDPKAARANRAAKAKAAKDSAD